MAAQRIILHLDLDSFFCAVEMQRDSSLVGVPFAVGGRPDQRGVVASCSYPARVFGVRSAMPMARALQLCPQLVIVRHNFADYNRYSREVMERLHQFTPLVEQLSIDEAFMDVTGVNGTPFEIAQRVQRRINDELGLPCSLGGASNKLIAKTANTMGKARAAAGAPPNAILIVPHGEEAAFLAPLPIDELYGVGPKTAERLNKLGVYKIGDVIRFSQAELVRQFGKFGQELYERARGIDPRPVVTEHETKSVSRETTFPHDVRDAETLKITLRALADSVGWRLRKNGLSGVTVKIKLRWHDFTTLTRQVTLDAPTNLDDAIYAAALALFEQTWTAGKGVRLIGVGVSGFEGEAHQLGLWATPQSDQERRLSQALDSIRERYGEKSVRRGSIFTPDESPDEE